MRERPGPAPQLAREWMRVRERDLAARAPANVRDREQRLDRVRLDVGRERRMRGRGRLEERANRIVFVQRESPAIGVRTLRTAAQREPRKREHDVRGDVALHTE